MQSAEGICEYNNEILIFACRVLILPQIAFHALLNLTMVINR